VNVSEVDFWVRLEHGLALQPAVAPSPPKPDSEEGGTSVRDWWRGVKRKTRWLDAAGTLFWLYAVLKIFVIDVDAKVVNAINPDAARILDYRIFFWIALLILGVILLGKWLFVAVPYILFFPIVVLVWKIPGFFVKRRSFPLVMAAVQTGVSLFGSFRYNVVSKGIATFAVLFILVTSTRLLIIPSALYLLALLLWSYVRLFRKTFSLSTFVDAQQRAIGRVVKSGWLVTASELDEQQREASLQEFDYNTANQVAIKITTGIVINRTLYAWAYQLDRYRRQVSPALMFNGLAFFWLFLGTIFSLTLVNYGLGNIEPGQFSAEDGASLLSFTLYSFATLLLQEAGGIHAVGDVAKAVQLGAALLGLVVATGFLLNIVTTARRERDEGDLQALVATLKRRARDQEERFRAEYSVSVEEAYQRLADLQSGLVFLLRFLTTAIPDDFLDTPPSESTTSS
jgi:hypothetical protein